MNNFWTGLVAWSAAIAFGLLVYWVAFGSRDYTVTVTCPTPQTVVINGHFYRCGP